MSPPTVSDPFAASGPGEQGHEGRFPDAVGSDDADHEAAGDVEVVDGIERHHLAV
jgi:hypothetical protein